MGQLILLRTPISVRSRSSLGGREEYRGPLGNLLDFHDDTGLFGTQSYEKAESEMQRMTFSLALNRAGLSHKEIDLLFAGDLQNQCTASSNGLSSFHVPYFGLYGACSTFGEGMALASLALAASPSLHLAAAVTSSHNAVAERQFRLPLEYGGQRTPTSQWTATAAGCVILERGPGEVQIGAVMAGRIVDGGIKDGANMGAAMAPAAADTVLRYFEESNENPLSFDAVVTGDLGAEGSDILCDILYVRGVRIKHYDCGALLYDREAQDVHAGGSGCGCSAAVMCAHFLPLLERGEMKRVLYLATGALMSPSSLLQGCPILGVAPLIVLEGGNGTL